MSGSDMAVFGAYLDRVGVLCGTCPGDKAVATSISDMSGTELDDGTVRVVFRCHGAWDYYAFEKKTARLIDVAEGLPRVMFPYADGARAAKSMTPKSR